MPQAILRIECAASMHPRAWITLYTLPCSVGVGREGDETLPLNHSITYVCPQCGNAGYRRKIECDDTPPVWLADIVRCADCGGSPPIFLDDYRLAALEAEPSVMEYLLDVSLTAAQYAEPEPRLSSL